MKNIEKFAVLTIAFAQTFATVNAAHASCATPKMSVIWSSPAEGATDVPTNTSLWLLTTLPLGNNWKATLDGTALTQDANGAFPLADLQADTDHVVSIAGSEQGTPTQL